MDGTATERTPGTHAINHGNGPVIIAIQSVFLTAIVAALVAWVIWQPEIPKATQLAEATRVATNLVLLAMLTGVGGMATVQFWKVLFRARGAFHRRELERYFGDDAAHLLDELGEDATSKDGTLFRPDLNEVLDSPTEILLAQISALAEHLMLHPLQVDSVLHRDPYPLLKRLAGPSGWRAVDNYKSQLSQKQTAESEEAVDVLSVLRYLVERNLDVLLITFRNKWRRRVRMLAVVVTAAIGALAMAVADVGPVIEVFGIFSAGLIGGFFSWLARDIAALTERRRS